jgi:chorismate--pyruvate lyase
MFYSKRWFSVKDQHHRLFDQGQPAIKPWLLASGSLTMQLRLHAHGQFHVQPLQQSLQRPSPDEARLLHMRQTQYAWVREVLLYGSDAQPWVHARSVMPLATLRGNGRRLKVLKNRSLGSLLFERHGAQNMPQLQQRKARQIARLAEGWTRRTSYIWHRKYLLVQETFLPAFVATLK